jgi:hypothetical protein
VSARGLLDASSMILRDTINHIYAIKKGCGRRNQRLQCLNSSVDGASVDGVMCATDQLSCLWKPPVRRKDNTILECLSKARREAARKVLVFAKLLIRNQEAVYRISDTWFLCGLSFCRAELLAQLL